MPWEARLDNFRRFLADFRLILGGCSSPEQIVSA